MNPHLFTHLFHEGVIVSTRKLVYDAGSNEEAIKSLMQAQHKAVMKDLKRGLFDDKIDQYMSEVPGLEPRTSAPGGAAAAAPKERAKTEVTPPPPDEQPDAPPVGAGMASMPAIEIIDDNLSEPIELPMKARTQSADRTVPVDVSVTFKKPPAPSADIDPPTEHSVPPVHDAPAKARTSTAQRGSRTALGATPVSGARVIGGGPPVEITEEELSSRLRAPRDTNIEAHDESDAVPRRQAESLSGATIPVRAGSAAAHNAASLPPAKSPSRPSLSPPIVTRPVERQRPGDSEVVEIYQGAPASADPPPGERSERAGTYSVNRSSGGPGLREKTGTMRAIDPNTVASPSKSAPIPAGLGRPGPANRSPSGNSELARPGGPRPPTAGDRPGSGPVAPRGANPPPTPPARGATQARPSVTAPIQNRSSTPANQPGGVVMTRPAVVVGQPPRPGQPGPQRVRKAREEEGRGFGQGLISEKSLDEVILAYLSEDADEK